MPTSREAFPNVRWGATPPRPSQGVEKGNGMWLVLICHVPFFCFFLSHLVMPSSPLWSPNFLPIPFGAIKLPGSSEALPSRPSQDDTGIACGVLKSYSMRHDILFLSFHLVLPSQPTSPRTPTTHSSLSSPRMSPTLPHLQRSTSTTLPKLRGWYIASRRGSTTTYTRPAGNPPNT